MALRLVWAAWVCLHGAAVSAGDGGHELLIVASNSVPTVESITVYQTVDGKRQTVGELKKFDKPLALPGEGPFEVFAKPKGGVPVKVAETLSIKAGRTHTLKLGELIGSVEVVGDQFPRANQIVLTDERDPGPGEKGHEPVQSASEYRVEMAARPGFYSVWVVPFNGAKAQRVVDRVRVQAGKSVRVGD